MTMQDYDRYKTFTRRTAMMAGGGALMVATLLGRMYYLQVLKSDKYTTLADENRIDMRLIPPLRGKILDRFGEVLATNRKNFRILLIPAQVGNIEEALDKLSQYLPLSEAQRKSVIKTASRQSKFSAVTVSDNLDWETFATINFHVPELSGIRPDAGDIREYPEGEAFAHVLGYVNEVSEGEAHGDPVMLLPGFRIGRRGIEQQEEMALRGQAGNMQMEVNAFGREIRRLSTTDQTPGKDVVLTIDAELQDFAAKRLREVESGAAVLMDVRNGDILALASVPGYDPNDFVVGLSSEKMNSLRDDPRHPLFNKAVQGVYPPGSTFKLITALTALETGVMSPNEYIFCSGHTRLGNRTFHCWKRGGHGPVNMRLAIKHSCDVYFYEAARRAGIDAIQEIAEKFGLNQVHDFGIPGEKAGLVPNRGWKIANFGEPWQQGETLIAGIGQGYIVATPVQLAVMTARIANGLVKVEPRIIRSVGETAMASGAFDRLGVSQDHLQIVRAGMNAVSNEIGGTAYRSRLTEEGLSLAGKTGTSQVRRISMQERASGVRKNEELPWELRDHALFVAFGPVEKPVYSVAVFVEHGGGGSKVAAPVARDIMREAQLRNPAAMKAIPPVVAQKKKAGDAGTGSG